MKKLFVLVCSALLLVGGLFAENKVVQVLTFNDFHGNLDEHGKNLGMAKLVSQMNTYKDDYENTIVVSAGDNYQGSAMSNLTYGAPVSAMFKQLDVVASAVGNHEFDWGIERTKKWQRDGGFKFVAANIVDKRTGEPVDWAVPYLVKNVGGIFNGVKVAFVGLTTPETAYKTAIDNVKDYEFTDLKETAEKWAKYLKESGKADVVIALTHVGSFQDRNSSEISGEIIDSGLYQAEGIDAIISGHSHQTVCGVVEGMPIIQAYKYGRCIGKLIIEVDENNKLVSIVPTVEKVYDTISSIIPDPKAEKSYAKFDKKLSPIMSEIVGSTEMDLPHDRKAPGVSVLGYLVTDILRDSVDAQIGIANSGGIREPLPKGDLTMGQMYTILPFDNTVVSMKLTGEQLKRVLNNGIDNESIGWVEVCGLSMEIDMSRPFGDRIMAMYLEDGTEIEMDKEYTVATIDFVFDGGDQYDFSGAKDAVNTYIPLRDVVVDGLKNMGPVNFDFVQPMIYVENNVDTKPAA